MLALLGSQDKAQPYRGASSDTNLYIETGKQILEAMQLVSRIEQDSLVLNQHKTVSRDNLQNVFITPGASKVLRLPPLCYETPGMAPSQSLITTQCLRKNIPFKINRTQPESRRGIGMANSPISGETIISRVFYF